MNNWLQAFDELIRQITIKCVERGALTHDIYCFYQIIKLILIPILSKNIIFISIFPHNVSNVFEDET